MVEYALTHSPIVKIERFDDEQQKCIGFKTGRKGTEVRRHEVSKVRRGDPLNDVRGDGVECFQEILSTNRQS